MRKLKFRGLTKESNWVYGLPFFSHGLGDWKITCSNGWRPSYSNPDEGESTLYENIDANTLGQFTGLQDKNGKDIYEGDIVETPNRHIVLVKWGKCREVKGADFYEYTGFVAIKDNINYHLDSGVIQGEIIGNIHENPELLDQ